MTTRTCLVALLCGMTSWGCGDKGSGGTMNQGLGANGMAGAMAQSTAGSGTTQGTAGASSSTAGVTAAAGTNAAVGGTAGMEASAGMSGAAGMGDDGMASEQTCATAEDKAGACKATTEGVYAVKIELDVYFEDEVNKTSPLLDPGRGKVVMYFKNEIAQVCADGSDGVATVHPCGTALPYFLNSANCTAVHIQFPDALWDSPAVPTYNAQVSLSGFEPGDMLTIAKNTGLLGITLDDKNAPWPSYMDTPSIACADGTGSACFPDHDGDGKPGVTTTFKEGGNVESPIYACNNLTPSFKYTAAPLSLLGGTVANDSTTIAQAFVGLRTGVGGVGTLSADCGNGVGAALTDDSLPSRVLDCTRKDGAPCTAEQATFIDQNTPSFHILSAGGVPPSTWKHPVAASNAKLDRNASAGPRTAMVRIGDLGAAVSCADVRATTFPAL